MLIDLKTNAEVSLHKICISTYNKDKFLTKMPDLKWTENINLAYCFESIEEAYQFEEQDYVQKFIDNEKQLLIWTDTRKSIYDLIN